MSNEPMIRARKGRLGRAGISVDERGQPRYCVCPRCGTRTMKKNNIPCATVKCMKCGTNMVGE